MPKQILAGGPGHASSTENVKVDVQDVLARIPGCVEDDPVSTFLDSFFQCDLPCLEQDVSKKVFFLFRDLVQGSVVLLGDEENMNGSLRIYIVESKDPVVFVHDFCRNLFVCDFAKDAFIHLLFPILNYSFMGPCLHCIVRVGRIGLGSLIIQVLFEKHVMSRVFEYLLQALSAFPRSSHSPYRGVPPR
jgi:hypothetical protein